MAVRPAAPHDIPFLTSICRDVQRLHADALPHLFKPPGPETYSGSYFEKLLADPDACVFVAVSDDGAAVGCLLGQIMRETETVVRRAWERLHFKNISVVASERGHGWGHLLLAAGVEFARRRGISTITGDVWSFNEPMRAFLRREHHEVYCESQWLDVDRFMTRGASDAASRRGNRGTDSPGIRSTTP